MRINRHNYEAFLLDQLEGRLSAEAQQELEDFLILNPDCASELAELEPWVLETERIPFHSPELLKKEFPDHRSLPGNQNFDMFSIARMEGDLVHSQIQAHQAMLEADDQKAIQWKQWQLTRLEAEPVLFPAKDRLKRRKSINGRRIWIPLVSAAAALAMLLVLLSRTPNLPQTETSIQPLQEGMDGENKQVEMGSDKLIKETPPVVTRTLQARHDPAELTKKQTVVAPEVFESVPSPESTAILKPEPESLFEADPPAFSAKQFSRQTMAREAYPDQIEPLPIASVTVPAGSMTLAQLSELGVQGIIEEYAEQKDLSLWKIAHAGINGINRLAGSDISLMASRDEEGDVSGFQLKSKRFSLTRPIHRDE